MRILLAEDDETIRKMYGQWLEIEGHTVLLAKDGMEGLQVFNEQKPELVITDFRMPNVNGATLTHHVKSQDKDIPVIILTGYSERFTRAEAEQIGANEYLQKPVEFARLKQIIDTYDN